MAVPVYGAVSVGTTAIMILPANQNRKSYIVVNTDTTTKLYIGPDQNITTSTGIEVAAGGNLAEDFNGLAQLYTGPIFGIAGSTVSVRFWERT